MGLFNRKKKREEPVDDEATDEFEDEAVDTDADTDTDAAGDTDTAGEADVDDEEAEEDRLRQKAGPFDRLTGGPFDRDEDFDEDVKRIDLGGMRIPVIDGMQLRLDVEEQSNRIMAVTVVHENATLQLQAFAAPRSEGLWNSVRAQLRESVTRQGGEFEDLHTALGPELVAKIPATTKDGRRGVRLARFAGVDGPRWFLRAVFGGEALKQDDLREALTTILRGVVVSRGDEPMAPRDLLPLKAPGAQPDAQPSKDDPDPFTRGPEITEVR